MELIGFIVIALLWAAFLLPTVFENRRRAPGASTRSFARSNALLATVSSSTPAGATARRQANRRRLRFLFLVATGASLTLVVAIWESSILWLSVSVVFDVALAAFVTMLLFSRKMHLATMRATVLLPEDDQEVSTRDPQRNTVRVIAS